MLDAALLHRTVAPPPAALQAPALIECQGLRHTYAARSGPDVVAIEQVDLSIAAGELVCLLGPSGCGKTTLLNMVAGFLPPTAGRLRVGGQDVRGPSPDRGVVFQDYSLFPWLTVQGNVEFGLRMAGVPAGARAATAQHHLTLVGLEAAASRYPFELSGGMKQRVAIARALATDPSVLLMDEPFAALDAMTRASLQAQLLDIQARTRKTVLFVTHNIGEAIVLGSRILVLSARPGRIVEDIRLDGLARPRRRSSPEFNRLYERLAAAIGAEAGE
ncbi:ABC transporter ATP-binding protein [Roseateles violae]|uniref:ABC transporter ATP-binding protein n=1 Tax=Roseateles violae TaxID=3058042 RepID=A0ABT8DTY2_9BURK|nr:ABC transporter ATP-binding protein [Pelomonas sp. PFR6]MDN3919832.1 ABC transporter ATP-binding protein [Pelomonas sp. PFR6]